MSRKQKLYIGVDPGFRGGIVVLDEEGVLREGILMPTRGEAYGQRGHKTRPVIHGAYALNWLRHQTEELQGTPVNGVIEEVGARPGGGAQATFRFGEAYGGIKSILDIVCQTKPFMVSPMTWKTKWGLINEGKEGSIARATKEHGDNAYWPNLKHDGVAEAYLIALGWIRGLY